MHLLVIACGARFHYQKNNNSKEKETMDENVDRPEVSYIFVSRQRRGENAFYFQINLSGCFVDRGGNSELACILAQPIAKRGTMSRKLLKFQ